MFHYHRQPLTLIFFLTWSTILIFYNLILSVVVPHKQLKLEWTVLNSKDLATLIRVHCCKTIANPKKALLHIRRPHSSLSFPYLTAGLIDIVMSSGVKKLYDPKDDKKIDENTFDWVQLRADLSKDEHGVQFTETPKEKLIRKTKENPFVPIGEMLPNMRTSDVTYATKSMGFRFPGVGMTTFFLTAGLISFLRKNSSQSQMMMRGRVAAQGFTICALVGGAMTSLSNKISR